MEAGTSEVLPQTIIMSCPSVQVLQLLLLLFAISPSIASPYSTACRGLFDEVVGVYVGYVEQVGEDDIKLQLNSTRVSNGTELAFAWTVENVSPSESFEIVVRVNCFHLEVSFSIN